MIEWLAILEEAEKRGCFIQGHAPFLSGRMLSSYLCGGATTVVMKVEHLRKLEIRLEMVCM